MNFVTNLLFSGPAAIVGGVLGIIVFFIIIAFAKFVIRVTLPDKIIVVTGRKKKFKSGKKFGFTVDRGRTHVYPYVNQVGYLDLGILPINVRVESVNSANGITLGADATACVCIDDDDEAMLYSAVERLMGKTREQIHDQIRQTLVGNFRGALNKATPLQAIGMEESVEEEQEEYEHAQKHLQEGSGEVLLDLTGAQDKSPHKKRPKTVGERAEFRSDLVEDINEDISHFGMKVVSVSLQKIWDTSNYIANLAQKTLSHKRQEVEIQEKRLHAKAEQSESDADRRKSVAKSQAEEKILHARQKVEIFRRESEAQIQQVGLEADSGISEAQNKGEREVQEQMVVLQKLKNRSHILLEAEARQKAAQSIAQGEKEAVNIREKVRNHILRQKAELLAEAGDVGKVVLFMQQQLPHLFNAYRRYAQGLGVDSLIIMDDKKGFNGAINRGPAAFVDFLQHLEQGLGVSVRDFLSHAYAPGSQSDEKKEAAQ